MNQAEKERLARVGRTFNAKKYIAESQFAPGSMLPKVEAAMKFAMSKPERKCIITSLEKAVDALNGVAGTTVTL